MESEAVYFKQLGKAKPLAAAEEQSLARRIGRGDRKAERALVGANLRFVVEVAKKYQNQGVELGDLIGAGNMGLVKAARRFDAGKNFKFISYAVWWIRQAILKEIADQSRLVRVPLNKVSDICQVNKATEDLEQRNFRHPSTDEIALEVRKSTEDAEHILRMISRPVPLDFDLGDGTIMDRIPVRDAGPDESMAETDFREKIEAEMEKLPDRQRAVLRMYFGFGEQGQMTLDDVGDALGITRERARQIRNAAMEKLRVSSALRGIYKE
jgi:RNA polymerase primary sigma factor